MWFRGIEKVKVKIQEISQEKVLNGDRQQWRVRVSLHIPGQTIEPWEPPMLSDPFVLPDRRKIDNYINMLDDHDNIDKEDAMETTRKLDNYRKSLFRQLELDRRLMHFRGRKIDIWICEMDETTTRHHHNGFSLARSIHRLHWEHLEDLSLWMETIWGFSAGPSSVTVKRFLAGREREPKLGQNTASQPQGKGSFSVLLMTARKHIHRDDRFDYFNPTNVLCSIMQAQDKLKRKRSQVRIDLQAVRPGTFEEFKACLPCGRHGNPFQIVHFDVHGDISPNDGRAFIELNEYEPDSHELKSVSVDPMTLAQYLHEHGVDCAVFSSCKTAVADSGVEANLARKFLNSGVASVVAMSYNVPDTMSAMFFHRFYHEIFIEGREVADAATIARGDLRQDPGRWSFHRERSVDIQDWFVPKYYSNGAQLRVDEQQMRSTRSHFWEVLSWAYILGGAIFCWAVLPFIRLFLGSRLIAIDILGVYARANPITSFTFSCIWVALVTQINEKRIERRYSELLTSLNNNHKNILRLESDLKRSQRVFLHSRDDVERTAPMLVTILTSIWSRTHLIDHRVIVQADWFLHCPWGELSWHEWRVVVSSAIGWLRLWRLKFSRGVQILTGSKTDHAGARTVVVVNNVHALYPEALQLKTYHAKSQQRFERWMEECFGSTGVSVETNETSHYLILIGDSQREDVQAWYKDTLGNCSVLESSIFTKYINPKEFPLRTENVATGRSWLEFQNTR